MQRLSKLVFVASFLAIPMGASAQPILTQRCQNDSLSPAQAQARIEWMRTCALDLASVPGTVFDTGMTAAPDYMTALMDYSEYLEPYKYTGDLQGNDLNSTFVSLLYLNAGTTQSTDAEGYYKWARPANRIRPRPLYPTFGSSSNINAGQQLWPHPSLANCTLYTAPNGTGAVTAFYVNGYCESSCYTPEQKLLFSDGEMSILGAREALREDLVTLTKDSTLDGLKYQTNKTYSYTEELRDAQHTIIEITTRSGGHLRVTDEHPVIQGEGLIVRAMTLKAGDDLVRQDGSLDEIISIEKTQYFGKVYNIRPVTSDLVTNVLVAEGFLVGSSLFQNDEVGYMNRQLLYRSVPVDIIP
jgi:hypothetical protein